jgi:hypothetical protein
MAGITERSVLASGQSADRILLEAGIAGMNSATTAVQLKPLPLP